MTWSVATVVHPATEPVTLAEAKNHLRVEHTEDDGRIDSMIAAARVMTEAFAGQRWITQTVRASSTGFPAGCPIRFPVSPMQSVSDVGYVDADGTEQTLNDVQTWADHNPPLISPAPSTVWPSTQSGRLNAISVDAVVGYGEAASVPPTVKQAMLLCLSYWYQPAVDEMTARTPDEMGLPPAAIRLLATLDTGRYY